MLAFVVQLISTAKMKFSFGFILMVSLLSVECFCIGPDWNNHPIMQQAIEDKVETHTTAIINVTYYDEKTGARYTEKAEAGKFGEAHVLEASGVLVHVMSSPDDSFTACRLPLRPTYGSFPDEPWIALVKRGGCQFQQKMDNAFLSNASGIIIYNDQDSPSLERMKLAHNVPPKEYSAVFTYKKKGEELSKLVDSGVRVMVYISIGEICPRLASNINKTSVLFVSVSFIVLMVVSLGWIVFYYVQKCRYIHAKERLSKRLCSAAKKALQKIPTRSVKSDEKDGSSLGDADCCAICIEPFKPADVVRLLPCRHEFHKLCIDPWLLENRTCPMCKMDILKYFGFELTGSQESMLRVENDDPFSDIFYFGPNLQITTVEETSAIVPVVVNHSVNECRPTTSSDCAATVSQAILDADAEQNTINIFGKPQKSFNKTNGNLSPMKRSVSLDNLPAGKHT